LLRFIDEDRAAIVAASDSVSGNSLSAAFARLEIRLVLADSQAQGVSLGFK
jgi:hypothetical protein